MKHNLDRLPVSHYIQNNVEFKVWLRCTDHIWEDTLLLTLRQNQGWISLENLTLNLERRQSPHPRGPAHGGKWGDPPSRASTSSFGSGTTL